MNLVLPWVFLVCLFPWFSLSCFRVSTIFNIIRPWYYIIYAFYFCSCLCCFCRQEGRQAQLEAPQLQEEGRAEAPPLPQEEFQEACRGVEEYEGRWSRFEWHCIRVRISLTFVVKKYKNNNYQCLPHVRSFSRKNDFNNDSFFVFAMIIRSRGIPVVSVT